MEISLRVSIVLIGVHPLLPSVSNAQVNLVSPEDGAEFSSPPVLAWESDHRFIFLVTVFAYGDEGTYHPFFIALPFRDSLEMGENWWNKLSEDADQYWAGVAFEGPKQPIVSDVRTFRKVSNE